MGGVASFNYNIINYSRLIKKFHSRVVLLKAKEDTRPVFTDKFEADEVITFHFSNKENHYYIQQRLNELLGNKEGAIVTDNAFTIQAARRFSNPKTVFNLIHDFFYVSQNIQAGTLVDVAIAHSSFFSDAVFAADPSSFAGRAFYIPYGVKQLPALPSKKNDSLQLVFLGRLDEGKGVLLLHNINDQLKQKGIKVHWTVIGKGSLEKKLHKQWKDENNIKFSQPASTDEVYAILREQDIFVFPTSFEGTPVSILECMSNAVVTIVNDLPGGIRDIVKEEIGFRCQLNNAPEFTAHIATLHHDRALLKKMQLASFTAAQQQYDITRNADCYFELFLQYQQYRRSGKKEPDKMSRLDKKGFSNRLVKTIRNLK